MTAFTGRLRQTVDLDTVRGDLVTGSMKRPSPPAVWLTGARDPDPHG